MGKTPYETQLIRAIDAINSQRPNISPAQHTEWERLVTEHEAYGRAMALESQRPAQRTRPQPQRKAVRSTYDPASISSTEAEIRRISSKGTSRTLAEDHYLRNLQSRAAKLNATKREADVAAVRAAAAKVQARRRSSDASENVDPLRANPMELRDGALKVLERSQNRLTSTQQDHLETLVRESTENRDAATVSKWICLTENAHYRSAFWKTMQYEQPLLTPMEGWAVERWRDAFHSEVRAASEAGSFGLAIPATIDPSIVPAAGELAPILSLCNVVQVTTNVYKGVTSAGSAWAFSSEGSAVADDTPTLAQPVVPINTAKAFIPASIELSMDYPDWMAEISKVLTRGYVDLMAQKSAVGAGTTEPTGLFTAMVATTTSPSHVTVTTVGKIGAVDVRAAWAALPQRFRASATWAMHEDVLNQVRNDAGAASQVDLVVDRQGTMLMGRPVVTSSYFPDFTGTTGSESFLTVGDLSGYTVASRLGVTVELIPQMRNTSGLPLGERGYLAFARVGGNVTAPTSQVLLANS